jgi:outer membrane receptor for ferrienterochelin and colicin
MAALAKTIPVIFLLAIATLHAENQRGSAKGIVVDQNTKESLAGANVLLTGTSLGASTDRDGRFVIAHIPAGFHTITVRMIGYDPVTIPDVLITPDRTTIQRIELRQSSITGDEVTVSAGYFKTTDVSSIGSVGFNAQEIRRSPGSANDVSRILMALPSVASVADNSNDLAVRGGSPMENAFFVDGVPVPNINHFPAQGSTGGPIGMLNIDFIDNVDFITSGFSSAYGDRLSSVVDIRLREGNTEQLFGKAFLNFAGFGAMAEGPLPSESGSWMFAANKSYLDLLVGAIGTGVAPRYGDLQGKAAVDIAPNHKLTVIDIFGTSTIDFTRKDAEDNGQQFYGTNTNYQNTTGTTWRAVWGKGFTSLTSLSLSTLHFINEFSKLRTATQALASDNTETNVALRSTSDLMIGTTDRLQFGTDIRLARGQFDYRQAADTNRLGNLEPEYLVHKTIESPHTAIFATAILHPFEALTVSAGVRAEYYNASTTTTIAPRLGIAIALNDALTVTASTGLFYQQNPLVVMSSNPAFTSLMPIRAEHYGAGLEYMVRSDVKFTLDLYDKEYRNLPLSPTDPTLSVVDDALFNQRFTPYQELQAVGRAYTRGVEAMLQKKMAEDIYGLVSASFFRSRYKDYNGVWRDRIYDNRLVLSVIGGYRPNRDWEASIRWTFAGGGPYTPFDPLRSRAMHTGIVDDRNANAERYPNYHSLNVRVDRKFYFERHMLDIYLSIWNAYNRKNVAQYFWSSTTNAQDVSYQWSMMPVVGVEYEF